MTTKVKVKKTRAERKQHSRDMQAKHEAEKKAANLRNILKRDILATLGIPKNHGGRAALSTFITEHLLKGESQVQIVAMLTGSELMKQRIRLPQTPGDLLNIRMAIHRPGIMEKSERAV